MHQCHPQASNCCVSARNAQRHCRCLHAARVSGCTHRNAVVLRAAQYFTTKGTCRADRSPVRALPREPVCIGTRRLASIGLAVVPRCHAYATCSGSCACCYRGAAAAGQCQRRLTVYHRTSRRHEDERHRGEWREIRPYTVIYLLDQ